MFPTIVRYIRRSWPVAVLALAGCGEPTPAEVSMEVTPVVGQVPLAADTSVRYIVGGREITFKSAQVYLSEIRLLRADGSEEPFGADPVEVTALRAGTSDAENKAHHEVIRISDRILLLQLQKGPQTALLGQAPAGQYSGLRFVLGIRGQANHVAITEVPEHHPLARLEDGSNFWAWHNGYIFTRIEGRLDLDGDRVLEDDWYFHLGGDGFQQEITLSGPFELHSGQPFTLPIQFDLRACLDTIDWSDGYQTMSMGELRPLAEQVNGRVARAFRLMEGR